MKNRIGEINYNNQGLKMVIIEYKNAKDIIVQFEDGYTKHAEYKSFKNKCIKNPNYDNTRLNNRIGETNINNQGYKMTIIRYNGCDHIDIKFDDDLIVYDKTYNNFKIGNIKHPIQYKETIAYHIEVELGLNLDDVWNWDKNNELGINPYEISYGSKNKIWLYCLEHDYHNYDREGNKIGYEIRCASFHDGSRCGYCRKGVGKTNIHYKDSLAYNYPDVAKMIAIPKNNLTFEDCYKIACSSSKKFYFKCNKCNIVSNKKYSLNAVNIINYSCEFCSDGLPITEKFMANIFKQLDIKFKTQLNKSDFKWCENFRYDFYLPSLNMIIETHGKQHYEDSGKNSSWKSLEQEQWNDLFKYKCAKGYIDNYIVIDCRYSTLEWMKENIIKELSEYFDLSSIDWELAWEESQNSLCIKAWELWNSEIYDTKEISKMLNISRSTVIKYLKQGEKINKCSYPKKR